MKHLHIFVLIILPGVIHAQSPALAPLTEVRAARTTTAITIDAILDEPAWQGTPITQFYQMEPHQGEPVSEYTEAWIAYDDHALYIAAYLHDRHPDSIAARLTRRDEEQMFGLSDEFDVYLDPYHDHNTGVFFCVTAPGSVRDGVLDNDERFDQSWDGVWESRTRITHDGWIAEIKIPFSQIRFNDQPVQEWGINLERDIIRKNELSFLVYTPRGESGFVSRFAHLTGIEGVPPPSHMELLPYFTTKAEYLNQVPGDPFNGGSRYSPGAGLDMKYGLGSNLTLDGTVNPDFGQVEVDPAIVNLTDVETFYPEKRPFFLEGINTFRFGYGGSNHNMSFNWSTPTIFYSRRVGRAPSGSPGPYDFADVPAGTHILGAAKVSGKLGTWNVGTLHALTRREHADVDLNGNRSRVEVEPLTYYGVARAQNVSAGGRQGIGILSTFVDRRFADERLGDQLTGTAAVVGVDGWTSLDSSRTYVLTAWGALSHVAGRQERMVSLQRNSTHYFQRPDASYLSVDTNATSLTGYAARLTLNKQRGDLVLNTAVGIIDPGFEPNDLGYLARTDLINAHVATGYRWLVPTPFYRQIDVTGAGFSTWDFGGNQTTRGLWADASIMFANYYSLEVVTLLSGEALNNRLTRGGPLVRYPSTLTTMLALGSDNRESWVLTASTDLTRGSADRSELYSLSLQLKLSSNLSITIEPEYERAHTETQWVGSYGDEAAANTTYGRRYVFARLDQHTFDTSVRFNWILTPTLSVQFYVQPLVTSGAYSRFKSLARTRSFDFVEYGENGSTLSVSTSPEGLKTYECDADGVGPAPSFAIPGPDFNFTSLRGNAVLRWEFLPGSTLYLVWTQNRADYESAGDFQFRRSLSRLWDADPDNIFMTKVSYWFDM